MQLLNAELDLDRFFSSLTSAAESALLLDYDGTLAPFHPERDRAFPYQGVTERLTRLSHLPSTRLIIVSGRWVNDLIPLLNLERLPEIWGCHGAERLYPDGTHKEVVFSSQITEGLNDVQEWANEQGLDDCSERKPAGFAFHWRGLPRDRADALRKEVESRWGHEAGERGLVLAEFDGGLELRPAGVSKGDVVKEVIRQLGGSGPLAYLGDDYTDEDAFAAMGKHGLNVLVRPELRPTKADLWVVPPGELLDFLDRWIESQT